MRNAPVAPTRESSRITDCGDVDAELLGGVQIEVGLGLAALDMLAAAVDVLAEGVGEAEVGEMAADPPRRAR